MRDVTYVTPTRPVSVSYAESQYADEVLRGLRMIMTGLGMIASAWARRYALDKVTYKKGDAVTKAIDV